MLENNLLTGPALQGSTRSQVKNGSLCPRPKCIPWPENELAAHVTYDLHGKRPVTLYNDRSLPKSAWAHSMTYNPSLLSCKIEIDNKMLYWFPCLHAGWVFLRLHMSTSASWPRWQLSLQLAPPLLLTFASLNQCSFSRAATHSAYKQNEENTAAFCGTTDALFLFFSFFAGLFICRHLRCFLYVTARLCAQDVLYIYFHQCNFVYTGAVIHAWRGSLFHKSRNCYDFVALVHTWGWAGGIFHTRAGLIMCSKIGHLFEFS